MNGDEVFPTLDTEHDRKWGRNQWVNNGFGVMAIQDGRDIAKAQNGAGINGDGAAYTVDTTGAQAIGFGCKEYAQDATDEVSPPIRAMGHNESHQNGGGGLAVAIQAGATRENPDSGPDGVGVRTDGAAFTIEARAEVQAVAIGIDGGEVAFALRAGASHSGDKGDGGMNTTTVATRTAVRRLTPRECERLQGFPDDYTLIPLARKKDKATGLPLIGTAKMAADGPRYKALGNSMAVNCMSWMGWRIAQVEAIAERAGLRTEIVSPDAGCGASDSEPNDRRGTP